MQFKRLLKYAGKYRKYLLLCPLVMIGEVVMEMLLPLITARLIDEAIPACKETGSIQQVLVLGLSMFFMALVSMAFGMAGSRLSALGGMGFARNLRQAIFEKVQHFSFKNIDHFSTASLVTRPTTDVNQTQNVVMMLVRMAVRSPIQFIMAFFMAAQMNASLLPILLVAIPILAVGLTLIMSKAFPRFQVMMKKYDALNASVQENLIGIRVVKAFVRANHEKEKFNASADDVTATQRAAERIVLWNSPLMQMLMYGCIVAILWLGGRQVIGGSMQIGALSSFISYIVQILMSLMMLSFLFVSFVLARASISRICEVLDEEPDIENPQHAETTVPDGSIVFEHVGFSYSGDKSNLVLSDVNLSIRSGETIGIIGGTGSAKSTLVSLIPRLYDVTCGRLLVGGRDVRSYDIHALRDQVSMVLQKNVLFSGTIASNLRWGDEHATDEDLTAACQASAADEFIRSFPNGYQTDLGQGGVNVSGGQKQRLCIARALLKKPKIIIFDDATSAVDTATDARIRQALRTAMPDTTKLIIAQRISSVMDSDRIVVLNDGQIADVGTHDELMERSSIYRDVYLSQQKGVA
ncbi:MAG: ABC transporter ATP-binding protein/permease [Clostridiales bacterium]|nr:ABC transporter ATP-binding protein/permease [Clostridiales bacterium]